MAPSEPSDPTTARPEHSSAAETKGNELKNYFMKMIETLKEEMKNSLEEAEGKKSKNLEEIYWKNPLKKAKKSKKKKHNQTGKENS